MLEIYHISGTQQMKDGALPSPFVALTFFYSNKRAMMALDRSPELRFAVKVMTSVARGMPIKVFFVILAETPKVCNRSSYFQCKLFCHLRVQHSNHCTAETAAIFQQEMLFCIGLHSVVDILVDFESMYPGFESRESHDFFFFFFFFVFIITEQLCKFNITVSTQFLLLYYPL